MVILKFIFYCIGKSCIIIAAWIREFRFLRAQDIFAIFLLKNHVQVFCIESASRSFCLNPSIPREEPKRTHKCTRKDLRNFPKMRLVICVWTWHTLSSLDQQTYHLIQTSSSSCVFSLNHLYLRYFNKKPKLVTFEWFDLSCFWKLQPIFLAEVEKQSYLIASSKNTNQRALKWSDPIGGKVHSFKWTLLGQFYFELCRFGSKKD